MMEMTFREGYREIWQVAQQTMDKAMQCDSRKEKMKIWQVGKERLYNMGFNKYGFCGFVNTLMNAIKDELMKFDEDDLPFHV